MKIRPPSDSSDVLVLFVQYINETPLRTSVTISINTTFSFQDQESKEISSHGAFSGNISFSLLYALVTFSSP